MTTPTERGAFEAWKAGAIADGMVDYWGCWQASRKQTLNEAAAELEGMTCNNATARSAIKLCIETLKEIR